MGMLHTLLVVLHLGVLSCAARHEGNVKQAERINSEALSIAQGGRLLEALPLFRQALELNPQHSDYVNNIGVTQMRLGLYHSAGMSFAHALKMNPSNMNAKDNVQALRQYLPSSLPYNRPFRQLHTRVPLPRVNVEELRTGVGGFNRADRPFILVGATENWAALSKWTPRFFATEHGSQYAEHYSRNMFRESVRPLFVPLSEALTDSRASLSPPGSGFRDKPGVYTQWNLDTKIWNDLLADTGTLPTLFSSDDEWLDACLGTDELINMYFHGTHWRMILIGTPTSGMFNHYDILKSSSWQVQIQGVKRWHLCAPSQDKFVYNAGELDAFNPDYDRLPRALDAECYEDWLRPGEVIFYPEGYWHQTETVYEDGPATSGGATSGGTEDILEATYSVSLTGTLVTKSNFHGVTEELKRECTVPAEKRRIYLTPQLCSALHRCYDFWEERLGGGARRTEL